MTQGNIEENLRLERERWGRALHSAELLLAGEEWADSVSRSYYAMLGAARALLLTEGLQASTHGGVIHMLNLHFVRTGRLPALAARTLGRLQGDRTAADYDRAAVFTEAMAREAVGTAREFCELVESLIQPPK